VCCCGKKRLSLLIERRPQKAGGEQKGGEQEGETRTFDRKNQKKKAFRSGVRKKKWDMRITTNRENAKLSSEREEETRGVLPFLYGRSMKKNRR